MPRIYLISRPDETINLSDYLAELLRTYYGPQNVLRGSTTQSAAEYAAVVERDLRASNVALVVMGPHWAVNPGANGQPWLSQPDDPTRIALATALRLGLLIVPVLSDGAKMPTEAELPRDLSRLPQIQAFPVWPTPDLDAYVSRLYQQINAKLAWRPASAPLTTLSIASALAWIFNQLLVAIALAGASPPDPLLQGIVAILFVLGALTLLAAVVVGVVIALQRRRARWLWLLLGLPALLLLTLTLPMGRWLTGLLLFGLLAALLAFALLGPRREIAFA